MERIQECALDLFDERGFAAVKIEDVAIAAGVSPSSIYRYFGTKEGLIVADEFDHWTEETLEEALGSGDPIEGLLKAVAAYENADGGPAGPLNSLAPRRVHYFFSEPSVRLAVLAALDRAGERIAPLLESGGALTPVQARVAANALAFGYFAALEKWHVEQRPRPIASYVEEGLMPLRELWKAGSLP